MNKNRISMIALTLSLCAGWAQAAHAQAASEDQTAAEAQPAQEVQEIIVTGSRLRAESVQKTPIAVSVLAPKQLDQLQTRAGDLRAISGAVPNLLVEPVGSSPGTAAISLRGFNTRTSDIAPEPGVAIYVDGVYQVINTGQMVDMFDLDKIEVLRGPQGTLLGKNAGAGAILLTRSRPTGEFSGRVKAEYGSYNLRQIQALVNFPILPDEVLSGKLFGSYRKRDGYIRSLITPGQRFAGEDVGTIRGALLFKPTSQFDLYLTADMTRDRSDSHPGRNISGPGTYSCLFFSECDPHGAYWAVSSATQTTGIKTNENNVTANANWKLGGVKLTSITGYRHFKQDNNVDLDSVPEPIIQVPHELKKLNQFSEEFRVSSVENGGLDLDGRLNWLIAGYYGTSTGTGTLPLTVFGATSTQSQRIKRTSYAVFGHVDFKIMEPWTVSAGARRSHDKMDHDYSLRQPGTGPVPMPYSQSGSWNNTSLEAGTQYQIDPTKMVYFRYAEGFRGGTFVGLPASVVAATEVAPETSKSYEVGLKSSWLDNTLQLNVTLFDVKYKNLQRDIVLRGSDNSFIQATANAANAVTKGVELEAIARPARNFSVSFNVGYLDAKYTRYVSFDALTGRTLDLSGQPLTYAPKTTISTAVDYSLPLHSEPAGFSSIDFHVDLQDKAKYQTSATAEPFGLQKGYALLNGSISLVNTKGFTLSGYVQNATNKHYVYLAENVSDLIYHAVDAIGRTFGGSLSYKF